jgi:hypothetical protein
MIEYSAIGGLIVGSIIVGIISAVVPSGIGKIIALVGLFPLVAFLILSASYGSNITNIPESVNFINWFVETFIPLFLAYFFEGVGVGIVKGGKKATGN